MTVYYPEDYNHAYTDAYRAFSKACLDVGKWAGPRFDQGLMAEDLADQHGSTVLTELCWQMEKLEPIR